MKNKRDDDRENEVRVELKYCERCGMLWMRECGSGLTFCNSCQPQVSELPILKKRPQSVKQGKQRRSVMDDYRFDANGGSDDQGRRGGAA